MPVKKYELKISSPSPIIEFDEWYSNDSDNHSQNTKVPKSKDEQEKVDNLKAKFDELFAS